MINILKTPEPPFDEHTITQSSLGCYLSCAYKYYLRLVKCLWPVISDKPLGMAMGEKFHEFLKTGKIPPLGELPNDKYQLLLGVIEAYCQHYGTEAIQGTPEVAFEYHLMDKWRICGIIDVVNDDNIWEHKLMSQSSGSSFLDELTVSLQRIYNVAAGCDTMIYNIIYKPGHRLKEKKGQTLEEYQQEICGVMMADTAKYFTRTEIILTKEQLQDVKDYFHYWVCQIQNSHQNGDWPKNYTNCFGKYGNRCMYFNLCTSSDPKFIIEKDFICDENKRHEELKRGFENEGRRQAGRKETEPFA